MPLLFQASNDLDRLGDGLIAQLAADLRVSDPQEVLRPQMVLVPTTGLRDWLRQRLARRLGICAGVTLCYPASLRTALAAWSGSTLLPATWSRARAGWLTLRLLRSQAALATYLGAAAGFDARAYQLAQALVDCFERYAMYRPEETLIPWRAAAAGPWDAELPWQPALWRQLLDAGAGDPVADQEALWQTLSDPDANLPPRLHAFGFNSMAPGLLRVLSALASPRTVVIWSLQPSWGYWGDQRALRELIRNQVPASEWGNRLLGDWGRVGRDFLVALDEAGATYLAEPAHFRDPGSDTLLARIQRDLVQAQAADEDGPHTLAAQDDSLQIHACHGLRRQLEVIKVAIHEACAADPTLEVQDIALMAPDPDHVAPLAAAILGGQSHGPAISVAIADRRPRGQNPAVAVLLRLLELLPGRFRAGEVLDFIGCAPVAQAWGLGAEERERLREWIERADLRWGVDEVHREACLGQAYGAASWLRGLQRLQLGWWYGEAVDTARPFQTPGAAASEAVVPVPEIAAEDQECLERLSRLLLPLLHLAGPARAAATPAWWQTTLTRLLRHVLQAREDDADLALVVSGLAAWRAELDEIAWSEPLSADLVAAALADRFNETQGGDYGRGAVTICGMQPMRSIPFRMLCLVGLDDDAFPRRQVRHDFDLLARHPQPGDRDLRSEDRYLLLELLISVRERLCIAYQGFDARDKSPLPPSLLVGELLSTAAATCGLDAGQARQRLVREHRLHGSLEDWARWPDAALRSEHQALGAPRQLAVAMAPPPAQPTPVSEPPDGVTLDELIAFWRCPAASWLRQLGVALPRRHDAPREHERFAQLGGLDRYQAAARILASPVADKGLRERLAAEGWLPLGAPGARAWQQLDDAAGVLHRATAPLLAACEQQRATCTVAGLSLDLPLQPLHPERGLIVVHPGRLSERILLAQVLRCCAVAVAGLAAGGEIWTLDPHHQGLSTWSLTPADPLARLAPFIAGWRQGHRSPLPFALRCSRTYVLERRRPRAPLDHTAALARCAAVWSEPPFVSTAPAPEADEPAHRLVWPAPTSPLTAADFVTWAEAIWSPIEDDLSASVVTHK